MVEGDVNFFLRLSILLPCSPSSCFAPKMLLNLLDFGEPLFWSAWPISTDNRLPRTLGGSSALFPPSDPLRIRDIKDGIAAYVSVMSDGCHKTDLRMIV